jgi:hypothetical protein
MDCLASKAATKNGLVLSSPPAASGIMVQSRHATTECEFDLAGHQIAQTGSNLRAQAESNGLPMADRSPS